MTDPKGALHWRELRWQRPLDPVRSLGLLRQWAADQASPHLVLETWGGPDGVHYLIGATDSVLATVSRQIAQLLPGTTLSKPTADRPSLRTATSVRASTRHRALRSDDPVLGVRALLTALLAAGKGESLVLQLVLGPRRIPLAVPNTSPSSVVAPWWQIAWHGNGGQIDGEKRSALRAKVADHGFACTLRLGVDAAKPPRRRALLIGLMAALRTTESPGLQLRLVRDRISRAEQGERPWRWPLRLGVPELVGLLGWPLGDDDLPGQPAAHPRPLAPAPGTTGKERVIGVATASNPDVRLVLPVKAALHHLHVLGPTGTGKSTLLAGLIGQDITAGRGVVVIEPKDLVDEVLTRIPESRWNDVVLLDPLDSAPVGLNPLAARGRRPELVADNLLTIFKQLYGKDIGPRSADILYAGLLTLARRPDASLVMLPLLLTNPGFRRSLTSSVSVQDPIVLGPFWAGFDNWSDAERATAIAPVMNKLRPLLRSNVRAVLGQQHPRFDLGEVFSRRRVLLVPLKRGLLGADGAALIGSLVVGELWQATLARTAVPAERRHPVMVTIDEVQDFLRLPTDLGDALAQARGLGVAFTLAHQYLSQLPRPMRAAVMANTRSKICFQLPDDDARAMARGHGELTAADFSAVGEYAVYASLFAAGQSTNYASARTLPPATATSDPDVIRAISRARYGQPLDEVEAGFANLLDGATADLGATGRRRRPV
jgi:hypothetical protein